MSHFCCVLIIQDDLIIGPEKILERVDQDMAPFMENCCEEPDKMYMKFYDEEDAYNKQYSEDSQEYVVMPDGRLLLPWDEEFRVKDKKDPMGFFGKPEPPKELERKMIPFKEKFSTFEKFVKEWHGRAKRDETYNRYGYFQNPNAKWDWFEIGGRWTGYFQLKPGRKGGKGSQYNFSGQMEPSTDKADICLKSAVDFEAMRKECEDEAIKRYDAVWGAIKGTPEAQSWEMVKAGYDLRVGSSMDNIDKARKDYHDQPRVKAFQKLTGGAGMEMFGWLAGVEEYQIPRDQYIQSARNRAAVPHAVIKDGKWYESGEMGWWGMASNEKDPETWSSMVAKLMDDLPDTAILVAIDAHI
jgi:hypothetical protein